MATRDMEGGKGTGVGKVGRFKQDDKQRKLVTEDKVGGKRVSFKIECEKNVKRGCRC